MINMTSGKNDTLAVLFDLDGTLSDSLDFIRHNYLEVFTEMGLPWGNDDVMRWIGRGLKDIARHFAGNGEEKFIELYQQCFNRDHDKYTRLYPGTLEMLEGIRARRLKTGLVTSKGRPGTIRTVELTGLDRYLDVIITAHDVEKHKPLPDPVLKALEVLNVQPANALFVGDSHFDMESGRSAGTGIIGVPWGMAPVEELLKYDPLGILENWDELEKYI